MEIPKNRFQNLLDSVKTKLKAEGHIAQGDVLMAKDNAQFLEAKANYDESKNSEFYWVYLSCEEKEDKSGYKLMITGDTKKLSKVPKSSSSVRS